MRIVVDTNVLVSGLLHAAGNPGRVVDGLLRGDLVPVVDDRILLEYREVLARPKFGFDKALREQVLARLDEVGEHVLAPPLAVSLPDPDDLPFLEVAACASVDALVTGNLRHFPDDRRADVLSPAELVARLAAPG